MKRRNRWPSSRTIGWAVITLVGLTGLTLHDNTETVPLWSKNPSASMREAEALTRAGKLEDALPVAEHWFGSAVDASARQIAGFIHQRRDEHSIAQPLFERALEEHLQAGDHRQAARDAQMLAGTLMYQELLGEALNAAKLGVQEADRTNDLRLEANTRLAVGKILAEIGDAAQARSEYWQAHERAQRLPDVLAWVYLELGMLDCEMDRREDATKLLKLALDLARRNDIPRVVDAALLNLARTERELGHINAADAYMRAVNPGRADQVTARFVAGLIAADRKESARAGQLLALAATNPPTNDYAIDIAVERGKLAERDGNQAEAKLYYRQAIGFIEKLRLDNTLELRPWVLAHRREAYGLLLAVLARENHRDEALAVAEQLHARTWYDALLEHAGPKDTSAQLASVRALEQGLHKTAPRMSEKELLSLLAHREILIFSDTGSGIWRFYVVDGVIKRFDRIPAAMAEAIATWRSRPDDLTQATSLGTILVPPEAYRRSARPLYIVADGMLITLPFAALRYGDHYLVERRMMVRVPGVVAFRCRPHDSAPRSALFLGDSMGDLYSARSEVQEFAALVGGTAFVGDDVTIDRFKSGKNATLLHLALHTDEAAAGPSFLLHHGSVSSADIVTMQLTPRLAILAGCATGISRDVEGWEALSSVFLLNGTRTVVATLQSVKDTDTTEILRRFYRHDGERYPAAALAMAQRELLQSGNTSTWASFVVYGEADPADCEPPVTSDSL